jgi:hypothetical protein
MKIPKGFTLAGIPWEVEVRSMVADGSDAVGRCQGQRARILVESTLKKELKEQTYCHELVHAILFTMGKMEHDEEFVDAFAHLLHQALLTAK